MTRHITQVLDELGPAEVKKRRTKFLASRTYAKNKHGPSHIVRCIGGPWSYQLIRMRNSATLTIRVGRFVGHYEKIQDGATKHAAQKWDDYAWISEA